MLVLESNFTFLSIGTAIYKGIVAACDLLAVEARKHPNADLRVVVLTDGQNNVNTHTVDDAVRRLADVGAVCDAILVGDRCDDGLRRLVSATEGECFQVSPPFFAAPANCPVNASL